MGDVMNATRAMVVVVVVFVHTSEPHASASVSLRRLLLRRVECMAGGYLCRCWST